MNKETLRQAACLLLSAFVFISFISIFTIRAVSDSLHQICEFDERSVEVPEDFLFGVSTSAYQIEGAWNEDGKGESFWDAILHKDPSHVIDGSNADVAADSYHHWREDVKAVSDIGFNFYRFSMAWTRILPAGDTSRVNEKGLEYYHRVIDECLALGIEPIVTIYHLDLPQSLQNLGGWANPIIVQYFKAYADVLFRNFGSKVKRWTTVNEPFDGCVDGYGRSELAPFITGAEYLCGHHILMAHAAAYRLYEDKYRAQFGGKVGITLNSRYFYPKDGLNSSLTERGMQYMLGWFAEPIFSASGGYPKLLVDEIGEHSASENLSASRLPFMDAKLQNWIRGTADFLSFNYYTSNLVEPNPDFARGKSHWDRDSRLLMTSDPSWRRAKSDWIYSVPRGLRDCLRFIKQRYGNPEILITENGWSDDGILDDFDRIEYFKEHMRESLKARKCDGVKVVGHGVWSLLRNWEWLMGFTEDFGIYAVDLASPNKTRTPKRSTQFLRDLIRSRKLYL